MYVKIIAYIHNRLSIVFATMRSLLITTGILMFKRTTCNLDLDKRLTDRCPLCKLMHLFLKPLFDDRQFLIEGSKVMNMYSSWYLKIKCKNILEK